MNQLYIKNLSGGMFKIPFKIGTPYDIQAKVAGVISTGKGILIPVSVVPYIDMERLEYHSKKKREIKVIVKRVKMPRVGIKPRKLDVKEVKKPKPAKVGKVQVNKSKSGKEES